jgi:hypothetical protein
MLGNANGLIVINIIESKRLRLGLGTYFIWLQMLHTMSTGKILIKQDFYDSHEYCRIFSKAL